MPAKVENWDKPEDETEGRTQHFLAYIIFHYIKLSGFLWAFGAGLGGLATGQAEVSYKFWGYSVLVSFCVLVIARIEGHRAERRKTATNIKEYEKQITELEERLKEWEHR